jgi:hypothetical protein
MNVNAWYPFFFVMPAKSGHPGAMYQAFLPYGPLFWPVLARGRLWVPACAGTTNKPLKIPEFVEMRAFPSASDRGDEAAEMGAICLVRITKRPSANNRMNQRYKSTSWPGLSRPSTQCGQTIFFRSLVTAATRGCPEQVRA